MSSFVGDIEIGRFWFLFFRSLSRFWENGLWFIKNEIIWLSDLVKEEIDRISEI